jgi:hypothetical protein
VAIARFEHFGLSLGTPALSESPPEPIDLGRPDAPPWGLQCGDWIEPETRIEAPAFHAASGNATLQATPGGVDMAKGEQRGNREAKKPKKEKPKAIAAAPSSKGTASSSSGSKK